MPSSGTSGEQLRSRAAGPTSRRRRRLATLSTVIGIGLAVGGGAFVVGQIAEGWAEYDELIADARWGFLVLALPLAVAGMTSMGMVWRHIIGALGEEATRRQVFVWYQLGQLGKYLPGGLWPVVGRSELATRGGLPRPVAYNSVGLSMGATYLCAGLVSAVLLPFVVLAEHGVGGSLWVLAVIPVGLAALHPRVLGPLLGVAERVLGEGGEPMVPEWGVSTRLVLRHAVPWLLNGAATWLVALTFDPSPPVLPVLFAGIMSWLVGFVVVFVPGGLGVREAAFTAAAATALRPEVAATVAIVSRLVFMAADALGAAVAAPLARRIGRDAAQPAAGP